MGDANGLDPPAKSQAMEGDLVGDLVGEKRGRELELEKKSGVNEWVGSSTSPSPHNLIQEPTAREPGGRLQEPTAIDGGGRSLCHVYTAVNGQTASGNLPPRGAALACTYLPPGPPAIAKGSNLENFPYRGQIPIVYAERVKT